MARTRLVCLILALVTLLAYLPVRRDGFIVFDDGNYITENHMVQAGLTWTGVKWAFTTGHASNWHPLTWLSHMLDCQLFGLNAGAHHLVNVLFHSLNAVLLLLLLYHLTDRLWPSAFVAALFAWHPLHVESVAWAAERKDVLGTLFEMLALLAYARYAKENRRSSFWLTLLFFALGLMAKPMLVTLPFVLLLLDYWPLRRIWNLQPVATRYLSLVLEKIPFFALSAMSCAVTYLSQRAQAVRSLEQYPPGLRVGNAVLSYGRYLMKAIWPVDMAILYPFPKQLPWAEVTAAALTLAILSWLVWRARGRCPYLLVGWLWYVGTLVPVIGLVQVGHQAMADRYTYVPLIGIFIGIVYGVADLAERFRFKSVMVAVAGVLVLGGCLLGTRNQLRYWRDDETLFAHAVNVTKDNPIARVNFGFALEQQGRLDEALTQYKEALRLAPDSVEAHVNLGNFAVNTGKTDEALAHYREALRLNPHATTARNNLGTLLVKLGQFDEAMRQYAESARLKPDDPRPHYLMGKACLRRGQDAEAVAHFRDALRLDLNDFQTLVFLSRVLASDANPRIRNGAEAVVLAERANTMSDGTQPFVLDTLAMAYAQVGRYNEAQRTIQHAIELATASGDLDAVAIMRERLQLYESDRPYRDTPVDAQPDPP